MSKTSAKAGCCAVTGTAGRRPLAAVSREAEVMTYTRGAERAGSRSFDVSGADIVL